MFKEFLPVRNIELEASDKVSSPLCFLEISVMFPWILLSIWQNDCYFLHFDLVGTATYSEMFSNQLLVWVPKFWSQKKHFQKIVSSKNTVRLEERKRFYEKKN